MNSRKNQAGQARVESMTWMDRTNGTEYVFEVQPGAPARVSVSEAEGGIHVVPLPEGHSLVGLNDEQLTALVTLARDRKRKAEWADEGGAT